jgi:hypothetical protein
MSDGEKNAPPVHEERLGRIKASVWKNDTENGPMFNVTFARLYHDGKNWKDSHSYSRDDCLVLARLADIVSVWIYQQGGKEGDSAAA